MLRYRFKGSLNRGRDAAIEVRSWVHEILDLNDDTVVCIASHFCGGLDCGDAAALTDYPLRNIRTRPCPKLPCRFPSRC